MKLNTLIVEDDKILHIVMKKILHSIEWNSPLLPFENGLVALNYLKDNYQKENTFVIFLDINMPIMNGWQFLDSIVDIVSNDNVFVYVLSSSINNDDRERAMKNLFVKDYIPKPVSIDKLKSIKEFVTTTI